MPLVYDELRRLATARMANERSDHTLQATALVHEAYLRLVGPVKAQHWNGRVHFIAAAAQAMRRILVENARRKGRIRHGAEQRRIDLDTFDVADENASQDLLILDEAITSLAQDDETAAEVVKLRYFAGMTIAQTAAALGISDDAINRKWAFARACLYQTIYGDPED